MLLAPPHERNAVGIEDTEVADQLVQATTVAGRRDHRPSTDIVTSLSLGASP